MVSQAVTAVEPVSAFVSANERLFRAHKHRNIRATKLCSVERISGGLLHGNIAGDRGDCQHTNMRRAKRHDQRDSVIGSGIGIDEEEGFHAALG